MAVSTRSPTRRPLAVVLIAGAFLAALGVAVGDLPLTVLPAEDMCDTQGVWIDWDVGDRVGYVFEADHVRQVPAHISGHELEAVVG